MLYKIDKNGCVVNEASFEKIQPYYRKILKEINQLCIDKFDNNLLSIYIRGSVSVGKAKPYISDVDSVVIVRKSLARKNLLWIAEIANDLEKKYPKAGLIDLTIISQKELLKSRKYKNLRVCLKTQAVCLKGKNILPQLPKVKPSKNLAIYLYGDLSVQLENLKKIFSDKITNREYLFQERPIKFWCIWMARVLLRAGLGLVMVKKPVYSQDLKTCFSIFVEAYPEYRKEARQLLEWSVRPISNKKQLFNFLGNFGPKFLKLWQKAIK